MSKNAQVCIMSESRRGRFLFVGIITAILLGQASSETDVSVRHCKFHRDWLCVGANPDPRCSEGVQCGDPNACFASWTNTSGEVHVTASGCWTPAQPQQCERRHCVMRSEPQEDTYFCCCNSKNCNRKIRYRPKRKSIPGAGAAGPPCTCKGEKGDPGLPGRPGIPGMKGTRGVEGKSGCETSPGEGGPRGFPGLPGVKGEKGLMGISGSEPPKGQKGDKGEPGHVTLSQNETLVLVKGIKGDRGPPGWSAFDGPPGPPGPTSPMRGQPGGVFEPIGGSRGEKGEPGRPGFSGIPGRKGDKGDPGHKIPIFHSTDDFDSAAGKGYPVGHLAVIMTSEEVTLWIKTEDGWRHLT